MESVCGEIMSVFLIIFIVEKINWLMLQVFEFFKAIVIFVSGFYFCVFTILDFLELDSFVEEASEKSCK